MRNMPFNMGNMPNNFQLPAQANQMAPQGLSYPLNMPTLPAQANPMATQALYNNPNDFARNMPTLPAQANPIASQAIANQGFQGRPEFAYTPEMAAGMNPMQGYGYGRGMNAMQGYGQGFGGASPFGGQPQQFGGLFNTPYLPSGNQLNSIYQLLQMLNTGRGF
jgi:hypothetical protein